MRHKRWKWFLILASIVLIAADLGVQAAQTTATAFNITRNSCELTGAGTNGDLLCTITLTSVTNGSIMVQKVFVPGAGGAVMNLTNNHQIAASVPAGISSTCGQCGAALDTAIGNNPTAFTP